MLSLGVDLLRRGEARIDGVEDGGGFFGFEQRAVGEGGEQVGGVRGGVDPVQLRVVSAEVALRLQIGSRFCNQAVVAVRAQEWSFDFPFRNL